jgi:hypothetical protein
MRQMTSPGARVAGWVGLVVHLAFFFWYAASGLVAPTWAVVVLLAVWVALLCVAVWLLRTRPVLVLLVPLAAALIWFGAVSAGDALLGWTA